MVNKLTNATSLTGSGLRDWLIQRVTSIVLAVYVFFIFGFILLNPGLQYYSWIALFSNNAMRVFTVLVLLSLVWHAWIGIWTIATDYLKPVAVRLPFQVAVIIALFAYFIWGVQILWGI